MLSPRHGRLPDASAVPPQRSTTHVPSHHAATAAPVPGCDASTVSNTSRTGAKRPSKVPPTSTTDSMPHRLRDAAVTAQSL